MNYRALSGLFEEAGGRAEEWDFEFQVWWLVQGLTWRLLGGLHGEVSAFVSLFERLLLVPCEFRSACARSR